MSSRTKHPRKAATTVTYDDPPEFDELDSDSEEDSDESRSGGTRRASKGKGKGKQRARNEDESSEEEEMTESEGEEYAPKRRKSVKSGGKGKGRAGSGRKGKDFAKLEVLKTMPVEILLEIFSHLTPNDLLSISAVSKTYRALLTHSSSTIIWKRARERYELPDSTAGGMTEMQYAQLMFDKKCQRCDGKTRFADFFLRSRLCDYCRRETFVRTDWLKRTHPDLHPSAAECVLQSFHSAAKAKYLIKTPYADLEDLTRVSNILWELQYAETSEESDGSDQEEDEGDPPAQSANGSTSNSMTRRSNLRSHVDGRINYAEESDEEEDDIKNGRIRPSRKVEKFVEARQPLREGLRQEGEALHVAQLGLQRKQAEERYLAHPRFFDEDQRDELAARLEDLEDRVLDLDLGYNGSDFDSHWYGNKLVVNKDGQLTDDGWERIKPAIIKLLKRNRRQRREGQDIANKQARQKSLRPRYKKLHDSLPTKARPYLPLFVDFLLLPSVVPLWEEEGDITNEVWSDSLDEIKEEIEQYRVELCSYARDVILKATMDPDEDKVEEDDELNLSDEFFARATSLLACSYSNCSKGQGDPTVPKTFANHVWDSDTVGSLLVVLQHQHKLHNFKDALSVSATKKPSSYEPSFHVHLPLEVACATSALLEIHRLDDETPFSKLEEREKEGGCWDMYEWENSVTNKHYCGSTLELLRLISHEVDKASKAKPPRSLQPPVIVYRPAAPEPKPKRKPAPYDSGLPSDSDLSDDDDFPIPKKKKRRHIVDLDLVSDSEDGLSDKEVAKVKAEQVSDDEGGEEGSEEEE